MALNRGRLFAAALFAGALFGGQSIPAPELPAQAGGGAPASVSQLNLDFEDELSQLIEQEDEEIVAVIVAAITSGALNG